MKNGLIRCRLNRSTMKPFKSLIASAVPAEDQSRSDFFILTSKF
jgi:hypothetical protein